MDKRIKNYMAEFPNNATSWAQATDEIRDLAHSVRTTYNECREADIKSLNFRSFKKPSDWNTNAKKQINQIWKKLTPGEKISVFETLPFHM